MTLQEVLRRLLLVSALKLPPGISSDADITADIDAQKRAAVEGGKAPAVTAARSTRKRRVQELKDADRMQLGRGSGAGFPVHTTGRELIGRIDRTTPGVFLDSDHPGVKNAGGTLRPPLCDTDSDAGSDAQSEQGGSEDESDDEPEDDESEDEADDPDPCPDNLTFLAGEFADPDPCPQITCITRPSLHPNPEGVCFPTHAGMVLVDVLIWNGIDLAGCSLSTEL